MLRPRVIPCLLIHEGGLHKTQQFGKPKYVGDPLNAVRIFNEKQVDEIMVVDIDASRNGVAPDMRLIEHLAAECRMPLCYGGGVKTVAQVEQLISLGVEKVALGSAAAQTPEVITEAAQRVGSQSVVGVVDYKRAGLLKRPEAVILNGSRRTGHDPVGLAKALEAAGVGEIVLNSVDRDGMMDGYDLEMIDRVKAAITVPLTVMGGAGTLEHLQAVILKHPQIGVAAGSLFVFKGKFRAVLINYPDTEQRRAMRA